MAKKSQIAKAARKPKYPSRAKNRCPVMWGDRPCGRPRGFMRRFGMCRICFRRLANEGKLPGVKKSSW
ncbi:MAG: type Z 30S ribosomal protein S14 [Chloroflexi bacterium]|jgi:small subunit ribosomal protein S14|nr:type Z 30S ribosomal protein S14 [Chloroflexota bacterium]MDA1002585.1 type Z 30S ribosomal protein S14 [Chloroflexota bacterium]MQC27656.1 type Z 30S ribosomal protein S14 [Chloroflexota bacterium]